MWHYKFKWVTYWLINQTSICHNMLNGYLSQTSGVLNAAASSICKCSIDIHKACKNSMVRNIQKYISVVFHLLFTLWFLGVMSDFVIKLHNHESEYYSVYCNTSTLLNTESIQRYLWFPQTRCDHNLFPVYIYPALYITLTWQVTVW